MSGIQTQGKLASQRKLRQNIVQRSHQSFVTAKSRKLSPTSTSRKKDKSIYRDGGMRSNRFGERGIKAGHEEVESLFFPSLQKRKQSLHRYHRAAGMKRQKGRKGLIIAIIGNIRGNIKREKIIVRGRTETEKTLVWPRSAKFLPPSVSIRLFIQVGLYTVPPSETGRDAFVKSRLLVVVSGREV